MPILTLLRCSTVLKCFLTIRECHISLVVEFYKENLGSSCEYASEISLPGVLTLHMNCVIGSSGKRETMHRVRTCGRRPDLEKVQNDKDLLCIDDTLTSLGAPWGQVLINNCHYFMPHIKSRRSIWFCPSVLTNLTSYLGYSKYLR